MAPLRSRSWLVVFLASLLSSGGCTSDTGSGEAGSLNVRLDLEGDVTINQVDWVITGNGMEPMSGTINTSAPGATPSVEVFGLPPGEGYLITMAATSVDGETTCIGSAEFDVQVGVSTDVMVMLNCKPPEDLGGVRVNGEFNICADLLKVVVSPLRTSVGNDIDLSALGDDYEQDDFEYLWEATGGSIADPSAADTTYTCQEVGDHEVRVTVSDDDFNYCLCDWVVAISCVGGLGCESDEDCRAGEVCDDGTCVPDRECLVDDDCDAGETCDDGMCIPDPDFCVEDGDCDAGEICFDNACIPDPDFCNDDQDCAPGEICLDNLCVPDPDFCSDDQDCGSGEICFQNMCIPDPEFCNEDQDCAPGEICSQNMCIPDPEFCEGDQDCGAGEICFQNMCIPDPEFCNDDQDCGTGEVCFQNMCIPDPGLCAEDADCDDQNECTANACDVGTGDCSTADLTDGTSCDEGNGSCIAGECRTNQLLGNEFVIVFEANITNTPELTLFLSGPNATDGIVSLNSLGFSQPFSVIPGAVTTVAVPSSASLTTSDTIEEGAAVHVVADQEITAYGLNRLKFTTDAFAALPTDALGRRHRVMAWTGGGNGPSQFAIAAVPGPGGSTTTPTHVTITPSATAGLRPAGVPYTITLNPFDAYQLQTIGSADLTGTLIEADRPISVYGGNRCANVPTQFTGFCDHLVEQLPPVSSWGSEVLTVPLATRTMGDTFRILADTNGTTVQLQGAAPESIALNAGEFADRILVGSYRITSDAPILVSQYSNGSDWDGVTSDPFMMLIPTEEQFVSAYAFTTPGDGFPDNFANVVALTADVAAGDVVLDDAAVPAGSFTALPGTAYSAAQLPISVGSHTLSSTNPVGLYVYGFASYDSYGYPGGFSVSILSP